MSKQLIAEALKSRPDRKFVWLNEKGEWMFSEHKDFPIKKTREDYMSNDNGTEDTFDDKTEVETLELELNELQAIESPTKKQSKRIDALEKQITELKK